MIEDNKALLAQHRREGQDSPDLYVDALPRAVCTGDCGQWPPDEGREKRCPLHNSLSYPETGARHRA